MNSFCRKASTVFLVLAMVGSLIIGIGCGDNDEGGGKKVTITLGALMDITGPAGSGIKPIAEGFMDLARYYNENNIIPGVTINALLYDTQYSVARVLPGYDWLRSQGAQAILTIIPGETETLRARATMDKVPVVCGTPTPEGIKDPGYVFFTCGTYTSNTYTCMKWIEDNQWDWRTKGPAKIGFIGWQSASEVEKVAAMQAYAQAHPDKWTYVATQYVSMGDETYAGKVDQFKDCDYICSTSCQYAPFWKAYLAAGHSKAIAFDPEGNLCACLEYMTEMNGWDCYDKAVSGVYSLTWAVRDRYPAVQLCYDMLTQYRTAGADISNYPNNFSYQSAATSCTMHLYSILERAVKEVGAESFNSEAFYDACFAYKTDDAIWKNCPEWSFDETTHLLAKEENIMLVSAAEKQQVIAAEWTSIVTRP